MSTAAYIPPYPVWWSPSWSVPSTAGVAVLRRCTAADDVSHTHSGPLGARRQRVPARARTTHVFAYVHGAWHPAVVKSRDRRTVVVDYELDPGPLGVRRQRVTIDRIRVDETST